jgi:hypothetical protein
VEIKLGNLTLMLRSKTGNEQSFLAIVPHDGLESETLRDKLDKASGPFGHGLNTRFICPIDLHYALGQLGYEFEVTEGAELVESYDPEIPEDAVT